MLESQIAGIEVLLLIAALVAMLARRLRIPYTIGLVGAGVALSFVQLPLHLALSKELIFDAFLPPLIFEAALHLRWADLRRDAPVIGLLASAGVLISAALTAAGMHELAGWPWSAAALFGALIAATDPVSVIATFKEGGVTGRLRLLMEGESLLNDGTAAVVFVIALGVVNGAPLSAAGVAGELLRIVGGGIACGALVAGAALLVAGRTEDRLLELTFTTVAAYGSFLAADHFGFSGVLATLTAGLMVGNLGALGSISARGRQAVVSFWEYAAFIVNSLIFMLIGLQAAHFDFAALAAPIAIAIGVVLLGRAAAIYPLALASMPRRACGFRARTGTFFSGTACAARWRWLWRWDFLRRLPRAMKSSP